MRTCLVVDDSSVIRKVARRILENQHIRVSEAENGQQAMEICRQWMPDSIFVDCSMPVMDGLDFLKELRATEEGRAPKIVFCTVEHDVAQIAVALRSGADAYIVKPFDRETLEAKFQEIGLL
ncbi:response regulator [Terrihabitans sp. B22-R8]|uniref:response regulator n=1 Tax=Terrihabitans sp. B22-R8 TaxID=3425128 RepID=UPI00403CCF91